MNYLLIEQLSKSYGEKELFENLTFGIDQGSKVALIARNGAGKSSLLSIISGHELPDAGNVIFRKDIRWAFLPQNPEMDENTSVFDILFHSENEFMRAIREYEDCLRQLKHHNNPELRKRLETATTTMEMVNGWDYDVRIKEILSRFKITDLDQMAGELSGGQRKKVSLAKVLLQETDLLILDEPTNHLDIEMIEWLEDYLSRQNLSLLVVTHDRYFLDNVCNEILELDNQQLYRYRGNYSYFLEKKAEREAVEAVETEKAKGLYRKELEWMRRMPQARSTKAKARIDAFYEVQDKASRRIEKDTGSLEVSMTRMGGKILEINNIFKAYDGNKLVTDFSYTFKKGERIGIVGKNGCGKSTLLNMIMGTVKPDMGHIVTGQTVVFGYYSQEGFQPEGDKRVIDIAKSIAEEMPLGKGRISASAFLSHFNFPHILQYNYFSSLSGGEKRRLFLLMQLLKNPNFLILDEPTNDLDIHTLNLLEEFLMNFEGCLLVVSHDRFFMDKLVDHVFVFEGEGKIKDFYGNYSEYYRNRLADEARLSRQKTAESRSEIKNQPEKPAVRKPTYKEKVEFESLEKEIASLEILKTRLLEKMNSGECTPEVLEQISRDYGMTEAEIDEKTNRWLNLASLFE